MPPISSIAGPVLRRHLCAATLLVAGALSGCIATAGPPPEHGVPVLLVGDSVLTCPAGQSYAVYAQFLHVSGDLVPAVFPVGDHAWVYDHGSKRRRPADLQQRIAKQRGARRDSIGGGPAFCAYFVTEFKRSLQARDGSGVAFHLAPDSTGLTVRAACTQDSSLSGRPGVWHLRPREVLVMRVDLEGRTYAMMLWAPTVPQEKRSELQREFLREAQAVAFPEMADLQPRALNQSVLDEIAGPPSRASAAQQ